ncbi:MAG: hypothetical protein ACFB00_04490 [Parvularculaceae bacterium]
MLKPTPRLLLFLFALMALLAWRLERDAFERAPILGAELAAGDPRTAVLSWSSGIVAPLAPQLDEAYRTYANDVDRFVLELNSPGGSLNAGRDAIAVIERMKRTHAVDARVGPRAACLSMCVPIFLRGEARIAAASSRWMFHEPRAFDAVTGERAREPAFERRRTTRRFVERYFVQSEMDPDWLAGLEEAWVGKDVWKSGRQLWDEGSNVITRLE